jgi:hypothetical protein
VREVAANRGIQTSTLIVGVILGFVLYAIFRHLFYILIGVAIGAVLVVYLNRRR